jgi:hypothetical protein
MARKYLGTNGDKPDRAWRIVGASSCHLNDESPAQQAYENASDDSNRAQIKRVCQRHGLTLH